MSNVQPTAAPRPTLTLVDAAGGEIDRLAAAASIASKPWAAAA